MGIFRKREGFVTKGNRQIQNGDTPGAQQTIIKGLDHYSNQILEALNGYPADGIQKQNPASKVLIDYINKNFKKPEISIDEKVEKTKKR